MIPAASIIRQFLIDASLGAEGVANSWCVFVGFLPAQPDNALCVYDTAGVMDGRVMSTGERIEHPGIQVMVRGVSYRHTQEKAIAIASALDLQRRSSIALESADAYVLHNVSRSGAIIPLGIEEEGDRRRHLFTVNATITVEKE